MSYVVLKFIIQISPDQYIKRKLYTNPGSIISGIGDPFVSNHEGKSYMSHSANGFNTH